MTRLLLSLVLRDCVKIPYFFNYLCTFFSVIWTELNVQSLKLRGIFNLNMNNNTSDVSVSNVIDH